MPDLIFQGQKIGGTSTMNRQHAEVLQRGEARMPRPNEVCDMSCAFAFCCSNYNDNGKCNGFQMLSNGKLEKHIREEILPDFLEPDRISVERYIQMIQQTNSPQIKADLAPTVYRYLKSPEKRFTMIGFNKFEINDNGNLTPVPERQPEKSKLPDQEWVRILRNDERQRGEEK